MRPRRGASPACSTSSARNLPNCARPADPAHCALKGVVARRMHAAVAPFAADHFITPMAAVAGSVAEEILGAMLGAAQLERAYVNNGGDIALHLADGEQFTRRPDGPAGSPWPDADDDDRRRRSGSRHRDQRPPRPQLLARHCRCRHRAGADRVAGRCGRDHHRQCGRSARPSRHRPLPGQRAAARQRSRRAACHPRRRRHCREHEIEEALRAGADCARQLLAARIDRRRGVASTGRDALSSERTGSTAAHRTRFMAALERVMHA